MLKLVRGIKNVQIVSLVDVYFSHTFFLVLPSLFMKKDDDQLFIENW